MHYAFDAWLAREYPAVQFDAMQVTRSCTASPSARQKQVLTALQNRMARVGLQLHPDKTKIVYCKDTVRRLDSEQVSFTFLGFTFLGFTFLGFTFLGSRSGHARRGARTAACTCGSCPRSAKTH